MLFVILFGAWVRISGSGDGCGEDWPTCHGGLVPIEPSVKTLIEYSHRATSGVLGPLVLGLCVWAWVGAGKRSVVRWFAGLTLWFTLVEAGIGAVLVQRGLVADNDSVARAAVIAWHLSNTLMLTAVNALCAWFGAGRSWPGLFKGLERGAAVSRDARLLLLAIVLVVLVSMTGAVTALGDTLFPATPTEGTGIFARLKDDLGVGEHFLVRLRVVHPVLAVVVGIAVGVLCGRWSEDSGETGALARYAFWTVWVQMAMGAFNIALGAPGFMQLLHLLLAQVLWLLLVLLYFAVRSEPSRTTLTR